MTWEEMVSLAEKEAREAVGKIALVSYGQIGDRAFEGEGCVEREFSPPLKVVVTANWEVCDSFQNHGLLDMYYDGDALPGQLSAGQYVSWFYGPTYTHQGKRAEGPIVELREPTPEESHLIMEMGLKRDEEREEKRFSSRSALSHSVCELLIRRGVILNDNVYLAVDSLVDAATEEKP